MCCGQSISFLVVSKTNMYSAVKQINTVNFSKHIIVLWDVKLSRREIPNFNCFLQNILSYHVLVGSYPKHMIYIEHGKVMA